MNALLVPFVDYNTAGIKTGEYYVGMYHFDMSNVQSVEPDEDGDTVIYHKYGSPVCLHVPTIEFFKLLDDSKLLNYYFHKQINKLAPKLIDQIQLTNKPRE